MNYGKSLLERLQAEKGRLSDAKSKVKMQLLQHKEDDFHFQIKFKDIDKYSIVLDYISISKSAPIKDVDLISRKLEEQAGQIRDNVTYLLESFRLIELDRMNKKAQLRSYPPYEKENSKYYYEIVLEEGYRVHFQRYQYSQERKRYEKITSQLTLEIFERLINDFVALLK